MAKYICGSTFSTDFLLPDIFYYILIIIKTRIKINYGVRIIMEKEAFMQAAIEESRHNLEANEGGPFGAVIVKNGKIIGRGHNQVLAKNDPTCHAEIQAIRSACGQLGTYELTGCQLYTSCYPCPMCLSAIIWANIKRVFYANTADDAAGIGFRDDFIYRFIEGKCQDAAVLELTGTGRTDAIKIFKLFEQKTDKTIY